MKSSASPGLVTFLNALCTGGVGGAYGVVDLYTFTLLNGTVLRWAAWPVTVVYGGNTYSAAGPYVSRSRLVQALKLEVSQIKITIIANPLMTIGSTPILAAISSGIFAGALVSVDRLFAPSVNPLDTSLGTLNWFTGQIAEVDECGRSKAVLTAKDPTALLSSSYPRNLYLAGCRHTFGDAGCTIDKSTLQVSGVVQSSSTNVQINTNLTQSDTLPAPSSAPSLSASSGQTGVNIPGQTYYVVITFTGANGESIAGPEGSITISGGGPAYTTNKLLIVAAPGSHPSGATGWNVYVGLASGQEQLQQSLVGFGSPWTQNGSNWLLTGAPPPNMGSSGYFAGGVITFTSGANSGLSQVITGYSLVGGLGVITTTPPLPTAPSAGDTFSAVPDCDKTLSRCTAYNNLIHFAGTPWIPLPEQAV